MAQASSLLFVLGVIATAIGFAAHVGHAVLLANGRRAVVLAPSVRPAFATGGVTGSFVTSRAAAAAAPVGARRLPHPALARRDGHHGPRLRAARGVAGRCAASWSGAARTGTSTSSASRSRASILGGYLFLARRYPIRQIGFIPVGVALAMLLYASSLPSDIEPLVPALQNAPLLTIHVGMAVISYGIFATSFAAGIGYLAQGTGDRFAWLPSHKTLDEVAYRSVIIGFPIFATMIVLGSWWASIAWSRYWGWDPKETAALVTWLIYAVYLHARNQRRWAGTPGGPPAGDRLPDGARDLLRQPLVQRAARLLGAVARVGRDASVARRAGASGRPGGGSDGPRRPPTVGPVHRRRARARISGRIRGRPRRTVRTPAAGTVRSHWRDGPAGTRRCRDGTARTRPPRRDRRRSPVPQLPDRGRHRHRAHRRRRSRDDRPRQRRADRNPDRGGAVADPVPGRRARRLGGRACRPRPRRCSSSAPRSARAGSAPRPDVTDWRQGSSAPTARTRRSPVPPGRPRSGSGA